MTTSNGISEPTPILDEASIQDLHAHLRGELIRQGDDGYDAARTVFNRMIDKRPALIARCAGVADVISAVNFARTHSLIVAVRGGGHSVAGYSVCDGGMVIDLSRMKGIRIDPKNRTARAEPGVTWGELNHDLQTFGLGATGGYVSITGIGGLTLSGGYGWLVRKHGLALDNLLSVDVVTADGDFKSASETENAELFWGIRGGGGNFGVVTSFEFRAHPVGSVIAGLVVHPVEDAGKLLAFYRDQTATFPDELTSGLLLFHLPPAPFLPPELHGVPVAALALCYAGDQETGEQVLRPLREFGSPIADLVQTVPYSEAQTMADALWPPELHYYWKSSYIQELSDDAIDTFVEHVASVPSSKTVVLVEQSTSGAIGRVGPDATAFAHRDWPLNLLISSGWVDTADTERNIRWTRSFAAAMQPYTADAHYSNYNSLEDESDKRLRAAFGKNHRRLAEVKHAFDPMNMFQLNANIQPAV
jgi:FAD/FMN-containing dehydrogenase